MHTHVSDEFDASISVSHGSTDSWPMAKDVDGSYRARLDNFLTGVSNTIHIGTSYNSILVMYIIHMYVFI